MSQNIPILTARSNAIDNSNSESNRNPVTLATHPNVTPVHQVGISLATKKKPVKKDTKKGKNKKMVEDIIAKAKAFEEA